MKAILIEKNRIRFGRCSNALQLIMEYVAENNKGVERIKGVKFAKIVNTENGTYADILLDCDKDFKGGHFIKLLYYINNN